MGGEESVGEEPGQDSSLNETELLTCLRFLTAGPAEEGRCCCSCSLRGEKAADGEFWENLLDWQPAERCLFLLPFLPDRRGLIGGLPACRDGGKEAWLGGAEEPDCRAWTLVRGRFAGAALRGRSGTGWGVSSVEEAL